MGLCKNNRPADIFIGNVANDFPWIIDIGFVHPFSDIQQTNLMATREFKKRKEHSGLAVS